MSVLGKITAPSMSKLLARKDHVQYHYPYGYGQVNGSILDVRCGARHAEILVPQTWNDPFRGALSPTPVPWYSVSDLTMRLVITNLDPAGSGFGGRIKYEFYWSSPGRTTIYQSSITNIGAPVDYLSLPVRTEPILISPQRWSADEGECWIPRKGRWIVNIFETLGGQILGGLHRVAIVSKCFRDITVGAAAHRRHTHYETPSNYAGLSADFLFLPYVHLKTSPIWDIMFYEDARVIASTIQGGPYGVAFDITVHCWRDG